VVADSTEDMVTIEPYPDPSIHPLKPPKSSKFTRNFVVGEEEEDGREPPPSNYDDTGILTAELASFSELKYFDDWVISGSSAARINDNKEPEKGEEKVSPLGPTNYSRLGPPPQAASGAVAAAGAGAGTPPVAIRDPEVLASLVEQLQQRRAELASAKKDLSAKSTDQKAAANEQEKPVAGSAPDMANKLNKNQKIRNPRHRGALQSAIGPMLRMLRNSEDL
jgi:hypothetical protein